MFTLVYILKDCFGLYRNLVRLNINRLNIYFAINVCYFEHQVFTAVVPFSPICSKKIKCDSNVSLVPRKFPLALFINIFNCLLKMFINISISLEK